MLMQKLKHFYCYIPPHQEGLYHRHTTHAHKETSVLIIRVPCKKLAFEIQCWKHDANYTCPSSLHMAIGVNFKCVVEREKDTFAWIYPIWLVGHEVIGSLATGLWDPYCSLELWIWPVYWIFQHEWTKSRHPHRQIWWNQYCPITVGWMKTYRYTWWNQYTPKSCL